METNYTKLKKKIKELINGDNIKNLTDNFDEEFDGIIAFYTDNKNEDVSNALLTEISDIRLTDKFTALKNADAALNDSIKNLDDTYKTDTYENYEAVNLSNLSKQLLELQIRLILMRCIKKAEVRAKIDAKPFNDMNKALIAKLKALNELFDAKTAKYEEGMMKGGGYNNQIYSKYMKYKTKYMKLKASLY